MSEQDFGERFNAWDIVDRTEKDTNGTVANNGGHSATWLPATEQATRDVAAEGGGFVRPHRFPWPDPGRAAGAVAAWRDRLTWRLRVGGWGAFPLSTPSSFLT